VTLQKILDRARDELFSHVNRCGVLQAAPEDRESWMNETIEYLGERFPDLSESDLRDLHAVGIRFCEPAKSYGAGRSDEVEEQTEAEVVEEASIEAAVEAAVEATVDAA
jgi:hypothetical protein